MHPPQLFLAAVLAVSISCAHPLERREAPRDGGHDRDIEAQSERPSLPFLKPAANHQPVVAEEGVVPRPAVHPAILSTEHHVINGESTDPGIQPRGLEINIQVPAHGPAVVGPASVPGAGRAAAASPFGSRPEDYPARPYLRTLKAEGLHEYFDAAENAGAEPTGANWDDCISNWKKGQKTAQLKSFVESRCRKAGHPEPDDIRLKREQRNAKMLATMAAARNEKARALEQKKETRRRLAQQSRGRQSNAWVHEVLGEARVVGGRLGRLGPWMARDAARAWAPWLRQIERQPSAPWVRREVMGVEMRG
ncbi:MAG: hypothetical protein M1826_004738 [Phylliscum demangeonii]|nr:MAG: hypothetical protein M1826_004738 [Phylliscum demangeonii]